MLVYHVDYVVEVTVQSPYVHVEDNQRLGDLLLRRGFLSSAIDRGTLAETPIVADVSLGK